jgi:hypothetical protein
VITPGIIEKTTTENPIRLYPNPGSDFTYFEYQLEESGTVTISLFDLSGRKIKDFINTKVDAGLLKLTLDISGIHSGIYFVVFQNRQGVIAKKLIIF